MGEINAGLERALRTPASAGQHHRPSGLPAQVGEGLHEEAGGVLGVSHRTVQRWVTPGPGRRPPGAAQMRVIEEVVRARWRPRIRERLRVRAEERGFSVHTRARFGFASAAGSSDDPRRRLITQHLSGAVARELFAARDAGAGEAQQMAVLARALGRAGFEWPSPTWSSPTSPSADPALPRTRASVGFRGLPVAGGRRAWDGQRSLVVLGLPALRPVPHRQPAGPGHPPTRKLANPTQPDRGLLTTP